MRDHEYSQSRGIDVFTKRVSSCKRNSEHAIRSSYKNREKRKRQTDFGDLRQKWEKRGGEDERKIFRELRNLCETYTLYPRFCTCISCTVIVVRPSTLSSLFVIAFLIRPRAKYPGTSRNAYLKRRRMYLYCLLADWKLHEYAQKKSSHKALHWYRLQRYCSLVYSKLAVNFACERLTYEGSDSLSRLPKEIPKYDEETTEI